MNAPLPFRHSPAPRGRIMKWALVPVILLAAHVTLMLFAMTLATGKNGPVLDPSYREENRVVVGEHAAEATEPEEKH